MNSNPFRWPLLSKEERMEMLELRTHELELRAHEPDAEADGTKWSIDAEARRLGVGAELRSFSLGVVQRTALT